MARKMILASACVMAAIRVDVRTNTAWNAGYAFVQWNAVYLTVRTVVIMVVKR